MATYNQQVIFDNGMSLAMMPEKSFVPFLKSLHEFGFKCQETVPVWSCEGSTANYEKLPPLTMNLMLNAQGQNANIHMPKEAYLKYDPQQNIFFLLISPWTFQGLGGKKGEEYWVMGAQFLQNYYSIYDFKNKKIGLVESTTSVM